jgi:2-polyprenyl-6-methoxyphenol hydroxylase-like FAD-dependent oxidoreductase
VVVGSGPGGLASAILFAQLGVEKIQVFDQLPEPPNARDEAFWGNYDGDRSYLIGLNGKSR